jgi:hypothetical protein
METNETLKIFVCETFIVNDGPDFMLSPFAYSMPRLNSPVDIREVFDGVPLLQARPPTLSFYKVRTIKASMN